MKKQIIISSLIAITILGGTGIVMSNKASAEPTKTSTNLVATTTELSAPKPVSSSKNETVFVITDESGNTKSKFIGNTIYDGAEELPFSFKVTYFLDGQEISGKDLAGKSGHVKIVYSYDSIAKYQNKFIPFIAVTGVSLDATKFSNLKITNGKIISESSGTYIITGYSFTGVNANLGTDILSESFTIEADATNFKLENTYTVFMNEIFADLDTSRLSDLDGLVNSINQLSNGLSKIIDGASDLSNGLFTALDGTKTLYAGSKTLASGLNELKSHNAELVAGATKIASLAPTIANLIQEKIESLEGTLEQIPDIDVSPYKEMREQIIAGITSLRAGLAELPKLTDLYDGIVEYTDGVAEAAAGATELSNGLGSLVDGTTKLYDGSITLKDGLTTLKTSGIDKLVNFANKDLTNFTRNFRSTVSAAASYKSFGGTDAKSVKFIVKTQSI